METRHPLYPEFGISKRLEHFQPPNSQPQKGRDVLERFFDVFLRQSKNELSNEQAAAIVAKENLQY